MTGVSAARLRSILAILVLLLPIHPQIGSAHAPGAAHKTESHPAEASIFTSGTGLNLDIPDGGYPGVMAASYMPVSGFDPNSYAGYITVTIWLDHETVGDLVLKLQAPNGRMITLLSRPRLDELRDGGCGGSASRISKDVSSLSFDDRYLPSAEMMDAGPGGVIGDPMTSNPYNFKPARDSEPPPDDLVSAFAGDDPNGYWILSLGDACANGKTGALDAWSLEIQPAGHVVFSPVNDAYLGLTLAIDNTSGAGSAMQTLAMRYGANTPLRQVIARLLDQAGVSPDPGFNALVQAYLHQLSYSTPQVSTLTLADFSGAEVILIDDTQVTTAPVGWGNTLDSVWLQPGKGFHFASPQAVWMNLGVRATPNRNYRSISNDGHMVIFHSTSAEYVGFASFFQPFDLSLPALRR
jgi:subtilisin-like proprotein convertase family protein